MVCLWALLSCSVQNLTVASLLIWGEADGAGMEPSGHMVGSEREEINGLVGCALLWAESWALGIGLKRSRPCQELLTLALEG